MRPCSLVLAGAMLMTAITACGGSDKPTTAAVSTTGAPAATLAPTSSTSTVRATTTTTIAATTTAAPTTAAATTTTLAPAPGATTTLPDCRDLNGPGTCQQTVPLRPDVDEILAAYRRFAAEDLKISQNPDNPDWEAFLATVAPASRSGARADKQTHFDRGEVFNTDLGVTIDPRSTQAPNLPEDLDIVEDCRVDGSYWADRVTGQPAVGETAAVRRVRYLSNMRRIDGKWYVASFEPLSQPC